MNVELTNDQFLEYSKTAINECKLFTDKNVRMLFGMSKKTDLTNKAFLGCMNSIFKNYGIRIETVRHSEKVDKKTVTIYSYKIQQEDFSKFQKDPEI